MQQTGEEEEEEEAGDEEEKEQAALFKTRTQTHWWVGKISLTKNPTLR